MSDVERPPVGAGGSDEGRAVVVGGGPAGMMAAEVLAAAGRHVTVVEAMPSLGRKLLMAGRGGLNLTHSEPLDAFLGRYGPERVHLEPAIRAFTPSDLVAWAEGLGEPTFVGTSGRVFPKAMKASPLLRAWLRRLAQGGVTFRTRTRMVDLAPGRVTLEMGGSRTVEPCDVIVLALGGASWPRLGSDGVWTQLLAAHGVTVTPLAPANCGVRVAWSPAMLAKSEGAALKRIAVTCGEVMARGEAIVTRTGLEGGAIYGVSRRVREALDAGPATLAIDLRPDITAEALAQRLARARKGESAATRLRKWARLAPPAVALLREAHGGPLPADAVALAAVIKAVPVTVTGLSGLERAISSAGGVAWSELDPRFMLRRLPGVFVAGEMLDWEAPTGGYLLQACMATGRAAGLGAVAWLEEAASRRAAGEGAAS